MVAHEPTVAVINSRKGVAERVAQTLEACGVSAVVGTFRDMPALVAANEPDILLVDLEPRPEVIAAFDQARSAGVLEGRPLIVTTADARMLSGILLPSDGATVFQKPCDWAQVTDVIRERARTAEEAETLRRPPDPDLACPVRECQCRLRVIESGWMDPPALEQLEPDVAVYTLECPRGHGRYQYKTGESLRPIVG
jgi:DNA-binding response OmpR family regulator